MNLRDNIVSYMHDWIRLFIMLERQIYRQLIEHRELEMMNPVRGVIQINERP
jgi:hypothetical protein